MTPLRRPITYAYLLILGLIAGIIFYIHASILQFEQTSSMIREGYLLESSRSIAKMIAILINDRQSGAPAELDVGKLLREVGQDAEEVLADTPSKGAMHVQVMDLKGQVIYDSNFNGPIPGGVQPKGFDAAIRGEVGRDILRGEDGVDRTTITCPILYKGHILGAVSSSRSNAAIRPALDEIEHGYLMVGIAFSLLSFLLVIALFVYFLRPIELWFAYSDLFRDESKAAMPNLRKVRLGLLGQFINRVLDVLSDHRHIEQMMYCLAHELRAPLASIHARAELMLRGVEPEILDQSAHEILRSTGRMRSTIDRLLRIAALEQRNALKPLAPVELNIIRKEVDLETQFDAERESIDICWEFFAEGPIFCEQTLLVEALGNLVRNAIEHSPNGSCIEVSVREAEKTIEFCIRDHGKGIPSESVGKVFDRFFSLPKARGRSKGIGLGLAFVTEVADIHYGSISLRNCEDGGVLAVLSIRKWRTP